MFDLHFHSTHSDGLLTVSELASCIVATGLKYCALTDHDCVDGIIELQARLDGTQISVIPGVELTAKDGPDEVHLLAYDFEIAAVRTVIEERHALVRRAKEVEMLRSTALFRRLGFVVSDGLSVVAKQPVSLTVAQDIVDREFNRSIFSKRHGRNPISEDIFWEYQAPGMPCYVEKAGVTVEWLLERLHGIVTTFVLAHPFVPVSVTVKPVTEARLLRLISVGVTGIEIYHNDTSPKDIRLAEEWAMRYGLFFSGGSDSHGGADDDPLGEFGNGQLVPGFRLARHHTECDGSTR